jgi:predicted O-methyltransferase YrrM
LGAFALRRVPWTSSNSGPSNLVTTELLSGKAKTARENLTEAGLEDLLELRVGDALQTLANPHRAG